MESIVALLKKFCPMDMMFHIKYRKKLRQQEKLNIHSTRPKIYFLDAPDYGNIGDQAIAYAIRTFADRYLLEYQFVEVLQDEVAAYINDLKETVTGQDVIFLTGGGNMGNVYCIYEATRRFVIRNFPDNPVIVFPQTIEYTGDMFGALSRKMSQRVYGAHKKLVLIAREQFSYEKMLQLYPKNQVMLCPDMVLGLQVDTQAAERRGIGVCLRDDRESALTELERACILEKLSAMNRSIHPISTATEESGITQRNRKQIVLEKIHEISTFELFVTDRLHGMIFAILARTPCVVFQNSNLKITGVYEWVKNLPYVKLVRTIDEFETVVEEVLAAENRSVVDVSYGNIVAAIRELSYGENRRMKETHP